MKNDQGFVWGVLCLIFGIPCLLVSIIIFQRWGAPYYAPFLGVGAGFSFSGFLIASLCTFNRE